MRTRVIPAPTTAHHGPNRTRRRRSVRLAALAITGALTLAACGGGDDDAADSDVADGSSAPASAAASSDAGTPADAPAMQPAAITFESQQSDGSSITIASIELPAPGFIAVHSDGNGGPGPVIGHSDLLPTGTSTDVVVTLDEPLTGDTTLYPMVHIDTDGDGVYGFGTADGVDGPGLTASGDVAVVGAAVTLAGGTDSTESTGAGAGEQPAGEAATITIADFAFSGVTEVPVGTTVVVTNDDTTTHTWTAEDGTFDSGGLAPGASYEFTFDEPGEFAYFCAIHPSMTGSIVVTG